MSSKIKILCICLVLGSCSFINFDAPRNMDNACSILQQRPSFDRAFQKTKRKWGAPVHVQMAILHQESKFIPNAKTPRKYFLGIVPWGRQSSAYGYAQALDGTWEEYIQATGNSNADRKNFRDASDFIGWYVDGSYRLLKLSKNDVYNHYLAYHEGRGGYQKKSFNKKKWLLDVAQKVERQAKDYSNQIKKCKFHKKSVF